MEDKFDLEIFKDPPNKFRPFPFLLLNDDLDEENVDFILSEISTKKKFGGVVLHPRSGLEVEYLSEEYFQKLKHIVSKCKELDLFVYLYDEHNWPSGTVGGKLLREKPEFRQKYLSFQVFSGKKVTKELLYKEDQIIRAFGRKGKLITNLSQNIESGVKFSYSGPRKFDEIILFYIRVFRRQTPSTYKSPVVKGELGYIDWLNPAAVDYFIQETHEKYKKYLGDEFGKTIVAMFIDEPGNYEGFKYTDKLFDIFMERKGYDLRDYLYQLIYKIGDFIKVRYDYNELAEDLYTDAFKKLSAWCEANDIAFTGHLIHEENLTQVPGNHGGLYKPLTTMQIPGIDFLSDINGYTNEVPISDAPNFMCKMITSISHAKGVPSICETYSGTGWRITPYNLKDTLLWLESLGVTLINVANTFLSVKGLRKRDYPPDQFVREPWWEFYQHFSDLTGRLTYFNSSGRHSCKLLYLFPKRTFWIEHIPHRISNAFEQFEAYYVNIGNALLKSHYDYDILFEEQILQKIARVEDGLIKMGDESYNAIVLPPGAIHNMLLLPFYIEFLNTGGLVIILEDLFLSYFSKVLDDTRMVAIKGAFGEDFFDKYMEAYMGNENVEIAYPNGGKVVIIPIRSKEKQELIKEKLQLVLDQLSDLRDITIEGDGNENFLYNHRIIQNEDVFLISNLASNPLEVVITFPKKGELLILDPETGEMFQPNRFSLEFNSTFKVELEFPETTALLFILKSQDEASSLNPIPEAQIVRKEIQLKDWTINYPPKNIFILDGPWEIVNSEEKPGAFRYPIEHIKPELELKSLPFRTRFLLNFASFFISIKRLFKSRKQKVYRDKFKQFEKTLQFSKRIFRILGLKWTNYSARGLYELMLLFQDKTKLNILKPNFKPGWKYEIVYKLKLKYIPDDLELIYEDLGEKLEIFVNNQAIPLPGQEEFVWDRCNRVVSGFSKYLHVGRNTIRICFETPNYPELVPAFHGIEPFVLRGSFLVKKRKQLIRIPEKPINGEKDWSKLGLPFYSGMVEFTCDVNIPSEMVNQIIELEFLDIRECARIFINGEEAGDRPWPPFKFNLTGTLKPGINQIKLQIYNTAENFFNEPIPSGLLKPGLLKIISVNKKRFKK